MGHSVEHEKKALKKKSNGVIKKSQRLNKWLFLLSYRFYDRIYWGQVKKLKSYDTWWVLTLLFLKNTEFCGEYYHAQLCKTVVARPPHAEVTQRKTKRKTRTTRVLTFGDTREIWGIFCKKYLHAAAKEFELLRSLFFVFEQFCVHFRVNFHSRVRFSNLTIFMLQVFEQSRNTSSWWLSG